MEKKISPKEVMSRQERKLFVSEVDRISKELQELAKQFPEFKTVSITADKAGYYYGAIWNDNYLISRTDTGTWHPHFEAQEHIREETA